MPITPSPSRIIISSDNTGALQQIFQGSPGKAQASSTAFRSNILNLLDQHANLCIALTWCPGHFDIEGNERADELAKSGSHLIPKHPNYKLISYIGSLHKCEIGEEWIHRWTNSHTTLRSNFHTANHIPPCTRPTVRLLMLDCHTFSHTIQCCTGHTHIREYYKHFVPSKTQECHCSEILQTCGHLLFECKTHFRHRHLLGTGRA